MTMYALYEMSLDELDKRVQNGEDYGCPVLVTPYPFEITVQVGGCVSDGEKFCVEIYEADGNGEFVSGSDFDTATHFYEQHNPDPDGAFYLQDKIDEYIQNNMEV